MTLQTNPASRREMVQAISERLNSPAVDLRMPACAYRIGELTVERDGSIGSDDEALLERLRPMLVEHDWLTDPAVTDLEAPAAQESGEEAAMESTAEAPGAEAEPDAKDSEAAEMELSFPVEDWTVPQLNNRLRTLYSNQYVPVSYTHRDVYKRQNYEYRQKGKQATLSCGYGGGVGALKAMGAKMPEEETVSDTQLDVYKRQHGG